MLDAMFRQAYPLALRPAQVRSAAAVACGAIPPADREDVVQDALVACWSALPNYDPKRASLPTYVECVVATRIASAVRAAHRLRALRPLDLAADHCAAPEFTRHELRIDVERLLGVCSDGERRLALLLKEHTPSQASRILGVARSTVYERIHKIRTRFVRAGLRPGNKGFSGRLRPMSGLNQRPDERGHQTAILLPGRDT